MRTKLLLVFAATGTLVLAGCSGTENKPNWPSVPPLEGEKIADFSKGESEEIFGSDGWSNGQPFNAVWKKENITYANGQMHLGIKEEEAVDGENTYPYTAAEARSHHLYGYGDFEVRMRPTNIVGTVSTFFTYTGEYDEIDGVKNKHDEIDIEFLGKDTTKVQFNYFVGGVGEHEYMYDLGFDASKEFHNYGFRWSEDSITWLVDGKTAYQVKKADGVELPSQAGRIMTSYWPSSAAAWSGKFAGATNDTVDYEWIKASGEKSYADADKPVDPGTVDGDVDWSKVNPTDVTFAGREDLFTITKNNGVTNIAYEQAGEWASLQGDGVADAANANNVINVTLKNNSATKSVVRVDVQGTTKSGNSDCLNTAAVSEGHSEVSTDLNWGGSKIELAAGEEAELIISYDVTTEAKGAAKYLLIFPDSLQDGLVAHAGGSISVSKVRFANTTGEEITPYVPAGPGPVDPQPEQPDEPDATWDPISAEDLTFAASEGSGYTVSKENGVTKVTYSSGANWANVSANVANIANTKDTLRVTLKNNATVASEVRVDIQGTQKEGNTDCLNVKAEAAGHSEIYTDTTWGGSKLTLAAGEKAHFIITYDVNTAKGAARNILIYLDSNQASTKTIDGNIEIRSIKFAKLGEDPVTPPDPQPQDDGIALTFVGNDCYTIDHRNEAAKSVNVTYSELEGGHYENVYAGLWNELVSGKNTFSATLKNNGEAAIRARVDVNGNGSTCLNQSSSAEGHNDETDLTYGGSYITLAVGETVTMTIKFDQSSLTADNVMFYLDSSTWGDTEKHTGDITLSNFVFGTAEEPAQPQGVALTFSNETAYTLDPVNTATETLNVTYTDFAGNSYANFGAGLWNELVEGKTTFSVTIKNNAETSARVRVDVKGGDNNLNVSASAQGHTEIWTDTTNGGSYITVAAGETVTFTVTFDQTAAAASFLMFFVDTCTWDDATTHSGNITLSNFIFA